MRNLTPNSMTDISFHVDSSERLQAQGFLENICYAFHGKFRVLSSLILSVNMSEREAIEAASTVRRRGASFPLHYYTSNSYADIFPYIFTSQPSSILQL